MAETGELQSVGVMEERVRQWMAIYKGEVPWLLETHGHTLGLATVIASEVARLVTLEMVVNFSGDGERAAFLDQMFEPLRWKLRRYVEYGCAGGGIVFKPYLSGDEIAIDAVQADSFSPLAFDSNGDIVSAAFAQTKTIGKTTYVRIEKHFREGDGYRITNECYKSIGTAAVGLRNPGTPASLSEVPEWENVSPNILISNLRTPLFSYFSIPQGNVEDPSSPLGVSVFARAVKNLREADMLWDGYLWEYKSGERAIDASEDAFAKDMNGNPILPTAFERLYRVNRFSPDDNRSGDLLRDYTPEIRGNAYAMGLNGIKEAIEDNCGLAHGTISKQEYSAKTATEIKTMRQRSYSTVTEIQTSLEHALRGLVAAMDAIATLYKLCPDGPYEVSFVWDDSIVTDADAERARDMQEVTMGLLQPYEYRMKWYGEDEDTAKQVINGAGTPTDDELMGFGK